MRLVVAAVGKLRSGPESALVHDYLRRARDLGRQIGFAGFDLQEVDAPKTLTGPKRQAREGALLLGAAPDSAMLIALDERGKNLASEDFAAVLARGRDDGVKGAAFLIGGADGHDRTVMDAASLTLSFGAATWPHMLVRVMLAEQLYRAMTILSGHPYHRS